MNCSLRIRERPPSLPLQVGCQEAVAEPSEIKRVVKGRISLVKTVKSQILTPRSQVTDALSS